MKISLTKTLTLLALAVLMGGCARGEQPRPADLVAPAQGASDFGDLRVHYNALPTSSLSDDMAREYGVTRDPSTALVFVALRNISGGEEENVQGAVTGAVYDLQGARQEVGFQAVGIGEYTDHIGVIEVSPRNTYRFEVEVAADGRRQALEFQRNF